MIATGKIRTHNPQHTQGRAHRPLDQPTFRDAYSPNYYLINVKHVGFKQQKNVAPIFWRPSAEGLVALAQNRA
jgi:hypothetical protein